MKKYIFTFFLGLICTTCIAQLNVYSNGNVSIKNNSNAQSALCIDTIGRTGYQMALLAQNKQGMTVERHNHPNQIDGNWGYALVSRSSNGQYFSVGGKFIAERINMDQVSYGRSFGVIGNAGYSSSGYNYGVFGNLLGSSNGAAIYGSSTAYEVGSYVDGRYAGYFRGNVKVTGSITVNGSINGMALTSVSPSITCTPYSASNEEGVLSAMSKLYATTYFKNSSQKNTEENDASADTLSIDDPISKLQAQDLSKEHYGLDINSLEEIFPNLVYENEDGTKSINYIEVIPLLVQSINELKAKLEEKGIQNAKHIEATSMSNESVDVLSISQNVPNPFATSTSISMTIPSATTRATLIICDMTGKQLQQMDITERGKTSVTITSEGLVPGMYLYALIADGQVISTKRMILN